MWNLLGKSDEGCRKFRDELEVSARADSSAKTLGGLLEVLPVAQRSHAETCVDCRAAAAEFLEVQALLKKVSTRAEETDNPWFAGRVMSAIAAREAELTGPRGTWIALPKLASRLALAAGAVLLVGSTWLYQRPRNAPGNQTASSVVPEYLFEAPTAPMTQDDVLASVAENYR
jgi:hypothetical protein